LVLFTRLDSGICSVVNITVTLTVFEMKGAVCDKVVLDARVKLKTQVKE